jgi:amino acid permease
MNDTVLSLGNRRANEDLMDLSSRHNSNDHTTTVVQSLDEEDRVSKTDSAGDSEQRALMFKARHIQMMALGS